jgi:hypothetical protein
MPIDIVKPFLDLLEKSGRGAAFGANSDARVPIANEVPLAA